MIVESVTGEYLLDVYLNNILEAPRISQDQVEINIDIMNDCTAEFVNEVDRITEQGRNNEEIRKILDEWRQGGFFEPSSRRLKSVLSVLSAQQTKSAFSLCSETLELLETIYQRYLSAKEEIVIGYLPMVVSTAVRNLTPNIDLIDLIQAGNLGLMRASEKYRNKKGSKFSTYANFWIYQRITRTIQMQDRLIRLPVHFLEAHNKIRKEYDLMVIQMGYQLTPLELTSFVERDYKEIYDTILPTTCELLLQNEVCLDDLENTYDETFTMDCWENTIPAITESNPEVKLQAVYDKGIVQDVLVSLQDGREEEIIRKRHGIGCDHEMTLEEIGDDHKVTRERIRQIEKKAMGKMLHKTRKELLEDCWTVFPFPWETGYSGVLPDDQPRNGGLLDSLMIEHRIFDSNYDLSEIRSFLGKNKYVQVRVAPGLYISESDILKNGIDHYISESLTENHCKIYAMARYAGEKHDFYPIWGFKAEYELVKWAEYKTPLEIFESILYVSDPNNWEISDREREYWLNKKRKVGYYHLRQECRKEIDDSYIDFNVLYRIVKLACEDGRIGWMSINRLMNQRRPDSHSCVGYLALLIGIGILEPVEHWQLSHPVCYESLIAFDKHLKSASNLDFNRGYFGELICRVSKNETQTREGWVDYYKLKQLIKKNANRKVLDDIAISEEQQIEKTVSTIDVLDEISKLFDSDEDILGLLDDL